MPLSPPPRPRTSTANGARSASPSPSRAALTDPALILSANGTVDHVSRAARRLLDLDSHPPNGTSFFDQIPSTAHRRVADALLTLSSREEGCATGLLQIKTGLGPWQWFKVEMTPRHPYDAEAGVVLRLHERGWPRNGG
jgi:hypothetical protein